MRRKKLPPKPEPPPEGCIFYYNELMTIPAFERYLRTWYNFHRDEKPDWRDDPTYHMKINKRRKKDAV